MKKESVKFIPFLLLLSLSSNATSQSAAQIAHATLTNAPLKWQSTYPKMPQVQHKVLASTFSANSNLINRTVFVGERGPHQRVWMKVADGQTNVSFIELATGMHYWEDNQWKESQELVESFPGGAIARHGQTQSYLC